MNEGTLLNKRFQLLERLGSGGMAVVYRARDLMLERYVAIKVLRADYSRNEAFEERFRQEARAAANLSHPNIVTVHDFGLAEGQLFLVMELVPGTDMKSLIRKRGRFSIEESIPLMIQTCAGIGYAHRAGLVHCDVKPHNMLVTPDQRLKVTDFGIARALTTIRPDEHSETVWGSPQYFSPEQAAGSAPSPASDVYSLGIVLYEMLTGSLPFNAATPEKLARMHIEATPVPISEYRPDIPPALEQIVMKVLSKEPAARYRTADQLGRVLLNFGTAKAPPTPALNLTPEVGNGFTGQSATTTAPSPGGTSPGRLSTTRRKPEQTPPGPADDILDIDWLSVGLGLLAMIAVLGLFPFGYMVFQSYNP